MGQRRDILSPRVYVLGPLAAVAGVLLGSFAGVPELVWVSGLALLLAWLAMVGAMWRVVPDGRLSPSLAVVAMTLPGVSALAAPFVLGRWPAAVSGVLEGRGADLPAPSPLVFRAFAGAWGLLSLGALPHALPYAFGLSRSPDPVLWLTLLATVWLPLSLAAARQVLQTVNPLAPALVEGSAGLGADDWRRERRAIRAALREGVHPAERAWAEDMLGRYARAGEPEAVALATALAHGDREGLEALLGTRPPEPVSPAGRSDG